MQEMPALHIAVQRGLQRGPEAGSGLLLVRLRDCAALGVCVRVCVCVCVCVTVLGGVVDVHVTCSSRDGVGMTVKSRCGWWVKGGEK